jgi:hypothetical protein
LLSILFAVQILSAGCLNPWQSANVFSVKDDKTFLNDREGQTTGLEAKDIRKIPEYGGGWKQSEINTALMIPRNHSVKNSTLLTEKQSFPEKTR